jgi:hypothetical protein
MDIEKYTKHIKENNVLFVLDNFNLPLNGLIEIFDWYLNSIISKNFKENKLNSPLLIDPNKKLTKEKIIILKNDANLKKELIKIVENLKLKNLSIITKDLKAINDEIYSINCKEMTKEKLNDEVIVNISEIKT